jgi:hypothetical protein
VHIAPIAATRRRRIVDTDPRVRAKDRRGRGMMWWSGLADYKTDPVMGVPPVNDE